MMDASFSKIFVQHKEIGRLHHRSLSGRHAGRQVPREIRNPGVTTFSELVEIV